MNIQTIYEGNIGVNKNNPQYPLDISGSVKFTTIRDTNNNIGSSGQVLSSTGNGLSWIDVSAGGGTGSTSIVVSSDTTDTTNFLTFVNNPPNGTSQSLKGNSNLIYDAFNNRVGIGTSAPSATLDVSGTANITGNLSVDTNTLFVDASNNRVGVGTTTPQAILDVNGGINASLFKTGTGTASNNAGFTNSVYLESNVPSLTLSNTGTGLGKYTLGATTGNFGIWNNATSNYPFYINSSNNVGIGTTAPETKLDVVGNSIQCSNQGRFKGWYSGGQGSGLATEIGTLSGEGYINTYDRTAGTYGNLNLIAGSSGNIRLQTNGNVGIGTTTPSTTLDVSGTGRISGNFTVDTNTLFVNASNNRVGFATTTPSTLLDCYGEGSFGFQNYSIQSTQRVLSLRGEGINALYLPSRYNFYTKPGTTANGISNLSIRSQYDTAAESGDLFTLAGNGNVGIGNSNPAYPLDVSGRANITGILSVDTNTLFVDASNNRVGVGTTTPSTLLDCYGEGSFGFQDFRTQATQRVLTLKGEPVNAAYSQSRYNFYTKPGTTANGVSTLSIRSQYGTDPESSDLFTLAGNGNVGIGTSTPSEKLNINGGNLLMNGSFDGVLMNPGSGAGSLAITRSGNFTNNVQQINAPYTDNVGGSSGGGAQISLLKDEMTFSTYPNTGTLGNPITLTERMRIKSTGVGINTTNPVYKLQVEGSGTANEVVGWFNNQGAFSSSIAVRQASKTAYITNHSGLGTPNYDGQVSDAISFGVSSGASPIQFWNGNTGVGSRGTAKMTILTNGNVGINTTTPVNRLDVRGITRITNDDGVSMFYVNWTNSTGTSPTIINALIGSGGGYGELQSRGSIQTFYTTTTERMRIESNGNVGIGTNAPTFQLQLSTDSAAKPTSNTWTISSDQRVKTNIENADLDRCNEIVENLSLKRFQWSEKYFPNVSDRNSIGFIAQEVEQYFPNAVKTHKNKFLLQKGETEEENIYEEIEDFKSLDIDQLIKCLFGSVKYLQNQVKTLEERIAKLE